MPQMSGYMCGPPRDVGEQQAWVLRWFGEWGAGEREEFLAELLDRVVPGKAMHLPGSLGGLSLTHRPPSIFRCQLRLWDGWFRNWSVDQRNLLLHRLEERAPDFTDRLYREVALTADPPLTADPH